MMVIRWEANSTGLQGTRSGSDEKSLNALLTILTVYVACPGDSILLLSDPIQNVYGRSRRGLLLGK